MTGCTAFVIHLLDPAQAGPVVLRQIHAGATPSSQPVALFVAPPPAAMTQAMPAGLPWMQADG